MILNAWQLAVAIGAIVGAIFGAYLGGCWVGDEGDPWWDPASIIEALFTVAVCAIAGAILVCAAFGAWNLGATP